MCHDLLKVVHVVRLNLWNFSRVGSDVAGDTDINQTQFAAAIQRL